jgi:hypothetical protein
MAKERAVLAIVAAALLLGACSPAGGPVGIRAGLAPPSKVAHTSADAATCSALDAIYASVAAHQNGTPAEGQALITAGLASNNIDLLNESTTMEKDSRAGDATGVQQQIEAMSGTCNSMGIGPPG